MGVDYNSPIIPNGHFTWGELARMSGFRSYAVPTEEQKRNAIKLATCLEPLRIQWGEPLIISSGARTQAYVAYLRKLGYKPASRGAHNSWEAVDLVPHARSRRNISLLWAFFDQHWEGRLELLKYTPGWVHADIWNLGKRIRFAP